MEKHRQHYLHAADRALQNYDSGKACIAVRKQVGHIGFSGYSMVKFRAEGASGSYLVTVYYAEGDRNIHDYRTAIRSHLLWLEALDRDTDLVVQRPVHNLSGDFITDVESIGDRPFLVTLLRWVDGDLVWDNYGDEAFVDLPSGILHNVGSVLGELHRHSSRWTPPEGFTRPGSEPEKLQLDLNRLRPAADDGRIGACDFAVLERTVCQIIEQVTEMDRSPRFRGLLHGDFSCGNCIAHGDEIRPIDFDWCRFGHFLADVGWCFAVNPMSSTRCEAFLHGYEQQCKFPDNHLRTIESFFIESCIRLLSWRAGNPEEVFPTLPRFVEGVCRKYLEREPFVLEWMEEL
ncbi:MAG: phosphotransferase [Candidatus Latescibacteria bacterium]|nr:phosphotransferase [Candidatus Latescibacterota bacterium]